MANPSATLAVTSAIHTQGGHSISHQAMTFANKTNYIIVAKTSVTRQQHLPTKLNIICGKNISHMAITSASHMHDNTISHPGINICQENNNSGTPDD